MITVVTGTRVNITLQYIACLVQNSKRLSSVL